MYFCRQHILCFPFHLKHWNLMRNKNSLIILNAMNRTMLVKNVLCNYLKRNRHFIRHYLKKIVRKYLKNNTK